MINCYETISGFFSVASFNSWKFRKIVDVSFQIMFQSSQNVPCENWMGGVPSFPGKSSSILLCCSMRKARLKRACYECPNARRVFLGRGAKWHCNAEFNGGSALDSGSKEESTLGGKKRSLMAWKRLDKEREKERKILLSRKISFLKRWKMFYHIKNVIGKKNLIISSIYFIYDYYVNLNYKLSKVGRHFLEREAKTLFPFLSIFVVDRELKDPLFTRNKVSF